MPLSPHDMQAIRSTAASAGPAFFREDRPTIPNQVLTEAELEEEFVISLDHRALRNDRVDVVKRSDVL